MTVYNPMPLSLHSSIRWFIASSNTIYHFEKFGTHAVTPKREYRYNCSIPRIMDCYYDMV